MRFYKTFYLCFLVASLMAMKAESVEDAPSSESNMAQDPVFSCSKYKYPLEVRAGYYYFFDDSLRDVDGNGAFDLQVAVEFCRCAHQLSLYFAGEFVRKSGHSLNLHEDISLTLFPLSFALKYSLGIHDLIQWYVTFGPRYVFLWQKNDSDFVGRKMYGHDLGFFGGTGFLVQLPQSFFFDFYAEGSYCRIKPSVHGTNVIARTTQVGGLAAGVGLGRNF